MAINLFFNLEINRPLYQNLPLLIPSRSNFSLVHYSKEALLFYAEVREETSFFFKILSLAPPLRKKIEIVFSFLPFCNPIISSSTLLIRAYKQFMQVIPAARQSLFYEFFLKEILEHPILHKIEIHRKWVRNNLLLKKAIFADFPQEGLSLQTSDIHKIERILKDLEYILLRADPSQEQMLGGRKLFLYRDITLVDGSYKEYWADNIQSREDLENCLQFCQKKLLALDKISWTLQMHQLSFSFIHRICNLTFFNLLDFYFLDAPLLQTLQQLLHQQQLRQAPHEEIVN